MVEDIVEEEEVAVEVFNLKFNNKEKMSRAAPTVPMMEVRQ